MGKPIRKYSTRDLHVLSLRGKPQAEQELLRRLMIEGTRRIAEPAPIVAYVPPPPRVSPSQQRRDARRAAEGKFVPS